MNHPDVSESDLGQHFEVLGHFYSIEIPGITPRECRDILEIRSRTGFEIGLPDAVFVMMNPGSSKPISGGYGLLTPDKISEMTSDLTQAEPDKTQYQVMRVMHCSGWGHVRVINLSDLHETKSREFVRLYKKLEGERGVTAHSVFSPQRTHQLHGHLLRKPGAPIVLAWGVGSGLNTLTSRAIDALANESGVVGWARESRGARYYHPLPPSRDRQMIWVDKILNILSGNNPSTKSQPIEQN